MARDQNDLHSLIPESVTVVFPGSGVGALAFYPVTVTLASLALPQYQQITGAPWGGTLHRYEVALYPGPSNAVDLTALATQFVTDWYLWHLAKLDQQFAGVALWDPEGMHEIEWRQAGQIITTRVHRGVLNPNEDLIYQAVRLGSSGSGGGCTTFYFAQCDSGILNQYISTDCGDTWVFDRQLADRQRKIICDAGQLFQLVSNDCGETWAIESPISGPAYEAVVASRVVCNTDNFLWQMGYVETLYCGQRTRGDEYFLYKIGCVPCLCGSGSGSGSGTAVYWCVEYNPTPIPGVGPRFQITLTGGPSGGTFRLIVVQLGGSQYATTDIAWNASAATVQAALEALVIVGANVTVTGAAGGPWEADFDNSLIGIGLIADDALTPAGEVAIAVVSDNSPCGVSGQHQCFLSTSLSSPGDLKIGRNVVWTANGVECSGFIVGGPYTDGTTCKINCGDTIPVECCPDPLPIEICVVVTDGFSLDGSYNFRWSVILGYWESLDDIGSCVSDIHFDCDATGTPVFTFTIDGTTYTAVSADCNPLGVIFESVDLTGCGDGSATGATVTIGPGPCNTPVDDPCCPGDPIPFTLCMTYTYTGAVGVSLPPKIPLSWDGSGWVSPCYISNTGLSSVSFRLSCLLGIWNVKPSGGIGATTTLISCDPFEVEVVGTAFSVIGTATTDCATGPDSTIGGNFEDINIQYDPDGCEGSAPPPGKIGTPCCPNDLLPTSLWAAFDGALASLGTVELGWDAVRGGWVASVPSVCGGTNILFQCDGAFFRLYLTTDGGAGSYGAALVLDLAFCNPFEFGGSGTVVQQGLPGASCLGDFNVFVTP